MQSYLRCDFEYLTVTDDIVFIRDRNLGRMSVTNDAEEVYRWITKVAYPGRRVVYQDSEGEWAEIAEGTTWMGKGIVFKPWHGTAWDILQRPA